MSDVAEREAFFTAIRFGDAPAVDAALRRQPALASARNDRGLTAVLWACYARQDAVVARLLAAGPELDVFEAVAAGADARARAELGRDPALARAGSADGFTALHLAAFFSRPALAEHLLALGADAAAVASNDARVQPLHSAAAAGAVAIAGMLLAAGAPPDARQAGGYTALMAAAQRDDEPLAALLLARGADPEARCDDGRTAADFADERAHHALAAWLRAGGSAR